MVSSIYKGLLNNQDILMRVSDNKLKEYVWSSGDATVYTQYIYTHIYLIYIPNIYT